MTSASPAEPAQGPLGGLLRHSAIYSAAPLLRQAISIGMTRFYTGWLGTAGSGVKGVVDMWLIALQQLLGQNVLGGMMRFYFEHQRPEARAKVVTSCTILVGALAFLVCGTLLLFTDELVPVMLGRGEEVAASELGRVLALTLLLIPFQLCTLSGFYYLMILKRSGLYTTLQTSKFLLEVALNFLLIGVLGLGVRGFLLSMLIGEVLASAGLVGWMLVSLRPRVDLAILRPILAYGAPLIPVGLCQMALTMVDRRLLVAFGASAVGFSMTGIYDQGFKISMLVQAMVISPFMQVWHPFVFGVPDPEERARLVARISTYCVLAVGGVSLGLILFGRQALVLLTGSPAFWEAYRVIPFIATGYVFWGLYKVSEMPLLIAKRTGPLFAINLLAALVSVGGNALLIPHLDFVGAGIMALVTFAFLAVAGMLASRSAARVPFELGRLGGIVACVLLGGALALWIDTLDATGVLPVPVCLAAKLLGLLCLWGLLWSRVLRPDERRRFLGWIAAKRRPA